MFVNMFGFYYVVINICVYLSIYPSHRKCKSFNQGWIPKMCHLALVKVIRFQLVFLFGFRHLAMMQEMEFLWSLSCQLPRHRIYSGF